MSKVARFTLVALLLALTLPAFAQVGGIEGKATNKQGQPVVGATVVFQRQDITATYKVKTDKHGHYGHYGLPLGEYNVALLNASGKAIYTWHGVHNQPGSAITVNFNLKKLLSQTNVMKNLTPEQRAAIKKQQEAQAKSNQQVGTINSLMKQNQQLSAAKQWAQAISTMQQAEQLGVGLKLTPKSQAVILVNLGNDYNGAKQYPQAIDAYNKALALDSTDAMLDANLYTNLGAALVASGKSALAAQDFDKAATLDPPEAAHAFYNEGAILYNSGKMDAAEVLFQKAVTADPTFADAWYEKGMCLVGKGKVNPKTGATTYPPGTAQAFETYLKLAPHGQNAASAKALLQGITGKISTSYSH
ncbi:MAG: tetratricopeptide repeat protein [Terriglobales bacterium]